MDIYCKFLLNQYKIDQLFFEISKNGAKGLVQGTSRFYSEDEQELRDAIKVHFFLLCEKITIHWFQFINDVLNFFFSFHI
jgi:hypothetical protein